MAEPCIFCEIAAGRGRASVYYEDSLVVGFLDVSPVTPGHALIVPRRHARRLADLDEETGRHLFTIAQRTAAAIRVSCLRSEGVSIFLSDGRAAGQEIDHVHIHVIPRYRNDGFHVYADRYGSPSRGELDDIAERIRKALPETD